MRINIDTTSVELADLLKSKIEKCMRFIFRNLNREVLSINLCFHTTNVGGRDNILHCQIHVYTRGLPAIYAEHQSTDLYVAFDAAAHRAYRYTAKRLSKFNRLLSELKQLKTMKDKSKTLQINKSRIKRSEIDSSQHHTLGNTV